MERINVPGSKEKHVSEELQILKLVTQRFETAGIPYMVTGSIALNFYATPRMTRDIDLVVELLESDAETVVGIFEGDFYVDPEMVRMAIQQQSMFNLIHHVEILKVDCIIRKDTAYRREEFARRRQVAVEGRTLFIVAPEDLILSKLEWGKDSHSDIQLNDVRNILRSVPDLDRDYLAMWVRELGLDTLYREVST